MTVRSVLGFFGVGFTPGVGGGLVFAALLVVGATCSVGFVNGPDVGFVTGVGETVTLLLFEFESVFVSDVEFDSGVGSTLGAGDGVVSATGEGVGLVFLPA